MSMRDGRADVFDNVNDGWGVSGDYHEYAIGSRFDQRAISGSRSASPAPSAARFPSVAGRCASSRMAPWCRHAAASAAPAAWASMPMARPITATTKVHGMAHARFSISSRAHSKATPVAMSGMTRLRTWDRGRSIRSPRLSKATVAAKKPVPVAILAAWSRSVSASKNCSRPPSISCMARSATPPPPSSATPAAGKFGPFAQAALRRRPVPQQSQPRFPRNHQRHQAGRRLPFPRRLQQRPHRRAHGRGRPRLRRRQ
jgi:hypothetical protein